MAVMRNTATTIIVATLIATAAQAQAGDSDHPGLLKRLFGTLSWKETIHVVETPRDAVYAVSQHVKYAPDFIDKLTAPEATWEKGKGDCEDIAHAVVELCEKKGFDAWVEVFYSSESFTAHAVAMGTIDGKLWISNGRRLVKVKNMGEANKVVARTMRWKATTVKSKNWSEVDSSYNIAGTSK